MPCRGNDQAPRGAWERGDPYAENGGLLLLLLLAVWFDRIPQKALRPFPRAPPSRREASNQERREQRV